MNTMAGRNLVINPKRAAWRQGCRSATRVTIEKNWSTTDASGVWNAGGNWYADYDDQPRHRECATRLRWKSNGRPDRQYDWFGEATFPEPPIKR